MHIGLDNGYIEPTDRDFPIIVFRSRNIPKVDMMSKEDKTNI
jgi:hypothetical protein